MLFISSSFAQQQGILGLKVIGVTQGEKFEFKYLNEIATITRSITFPSRRINFGTAYKIEQISGPRKCIIQYPTGTITTTRTNVDVDCTPTLKNVELVSRSKDSKTFATFYGSVAPAVGGVIATGVNEGQYITYMTSWNVDPKHGGKNRQIIWFNRGNGQTALVSRGLDGFGANKDSYEPVINSRGYEVAFESSATNLVPKDVNNASDVFMWSLMTDQMHCITCEGNSHSSAASISGNAGFIAFQSNASNLTPGVEGNSTTNVYVKNTVTGETILISKDPKTGKGVGGMYPSISEDGSRIAFYSNSDKLVDGDTNRLWDIFIWESGNPNLKRISLTASGAERNQGNESTSRVVKPTISGNGKFVTFATTATNMIGDETTPIQQVYVADIETGAIVRASQTEGGIIADKDSPIAQGDRIAISYNGKWIAFPTAATNLGGNVILKNLETGKILAVGTPTNGSVGTVSISRDGNTIAFPSGEKLDKKHNSTGIFTVSN